MTPGVTLDLLPLSHEPLCPPRPDLPTELCFAGEWRRLMAGEGCDDLSPLGCILYALAAEPTQRQASIAASFVTWLGSNCGAAFLAEAERLCERLPRDRAYLATWALHNHRRTAVNGGRRTVEIVAAPLPTPLALDDAEVIEHVVEWLAGEQGQEFIADCQALREYRAPLRAMAPPAPAAAPSAYDW